MPSLTRIRVRYKDTDTMSVDGVGHELHCAAELGATSYRDSPFIRVASGTAEDNLLAVGLSSRQPRSGSAHGSAQQNERKSERTSRSLWPMSRAACLEG